MNTRLSPPLLEAFDLTIECEGEELRIGDLRCDGPSLGCAKRSSALLESLVFPNRILHGALRLRGQAPQKRLADGSAAFAPRRLPAPGSAKVGEVLGLSADLVGQGRKTIGKRLALFGISEAKKKRLSALSPLEHSLVGLIHGLLSDPDILLVEDLHFGLSERQSGILYPQIEKAREGRDCIISSRGEDPESIARVLGCTQILDSESLNLLTPAQYAESEYWVTCLDPVFSLSEALKQSGFQVTPGPNPLVLRTSKISAQAIYRQAEESGVRIIELCRA